MDSHDTKSINGAPEAPNYTLFTTAIRSVRKFRLQTSLVCGLKFEVSDFKGCALSEWILTTQRIAPVR
jgi:hypothetical protein